MDEWLTKSPKNLKHARELLDGWKEAYAEIAARAFLAVAVYEQYLLDQAGHQELAAVMKELLEVLPDHTFGDDGGDKGKR